MGQALVHLWHMIKYGGWLAVIAIFLTMWAGGEPSCSVTPPAAGSIESKYSCNNFVGTRTGTELVRGTDDETAKWELRIEAAVPGAFLGCLFGLAFPELRKRFGGEAD